jgi:signal transduction histidine kinase
MVTITRLRLRAVFLEDHETQAAIDADLDEMEAMIEATLAYLRGDFESEPKQVTDLAALLSTLVDQATDAGADAAYHGPNHVAVELHPSLVKRAFANLVNNAVTYGGNACVTLAVLDSGIQVKVEDDGPGIPDGDLERVFLPFQRLDASRNRGTGGVGLGLAIARRGIEHDGGQLRLSNRQAGGLCALVSLPLALLGKPVLGIEEFGAVGSALMADGGLPPIPANAAHVSS